MRKLAVFFALACFASPAFAAEAGVLKLSLWDKIAVAIPNNTQTVTGIDLGIGSTTRVMKGFQWDIVLAQSTEEMAGLSHAFIAALGSEVTGVQGALLAKADDLTGVQWGVINLTTNAVTGVQFGFYNQAEHAHGLQLGFVNYAKMIKGLQIGLVNIAENGWFPAMILVNGRF